jgi:AraC-like DNA-binding protein
VWHRYRPDPETGWQERWISLNGQTVHQLMDHEFISPSRPVCECSGAEELSRRFDRLLDRIHSKPTENSILLSLRAMDFVAEVIEQTATQPLPIAANPSGPIEGVTDSLVARTLELIWTYSHRPLSVDQLVADLPVSRRTLERRFAQERSHSILDEINICRVNRAKRLLAETDLPVKTVAYLAGFTSQEHMRVTYSKQQGCSPSAYRRQLQARGAGRPAPGRD